MRIPFDAFTQYYCWGSPYFIFWHRSFCLSVIDDGREKCVIDFKNIRCRLFIIIYLLLPCYIRQFVCICVPLCVVRMGEAIQTSAPSLNLFFLLYFLIFFGGSNSLSIYQYTLLGWLLLLMALFAHFPLFHMYSSATHKKKEILCRRVRWEKTDRVSDDATTHKQITTFLASAII